MKGQLQNKLIILGIVAALAIGGAVFAMSRAKGSQSPENAPPPPSSQSAAASAARGRPAVKDGTVLTDRGTLMRGMVFGAGEMLMGESDEGMRVSFEDVANIKEQGVNCVRFSVPLQHQEKGSEEYMKSLWAADTFIDWAEELGLYVWLSADNAEDPIAGAIRFDSIIDYWDELAPRYADRPHVFFDLVNELSEPPDFVEWIYPRGTVTEFYAKLFGLVRSHAPDTLCIFFSFSHSLDMDDTISQIQGLEELIEISWANEAVGFHCYEAVNKYRDEDTWLSSELMRSEIRRFSESGYPIMNTEVPSMAVSYGGKSELSDFPNAHLLRVLEEESVSWSTMMDIQAIGEPSVWRAAVERAGLAWTPDFGSWPAPGLANPFERQAAVSQPYEAHKTPLSLGDAADTEDMGNIHENYIPCLYVNKESHITYKDIGFGVLEPFSLTVRARGFHDGAKIIAREGGPGGPVLCEIPIRHTKGENAYYTGTLMRPVSGVKDITFTFADPEGMDCWALCYFIEWQFAEPPHYTETIRTDIWNKTTPAAHFNFRSGDIRRAPGADTGAATEVGRALQVEGIKDDSRILFSLAPFLAGGDATFTVRAKTLAGGRIELYPNKGFKLWPMWAFPLGHCEINGTRGEWEEFTFTIPAELLDAVVYGGSIPINGQDLMLRFVANDGASKDVELFAISEFSFARQ